MSTPDELPLHIQERYGLKNRAIKKRITMVIATGITSAFIIFTYLVLNRPHVAFELQAFTVATDSQVNVSWQVSRPAGTATYCALRAQDSKRQDVGYVIVTIAPGPAIVTQNYSMATESLATLAEILGCGATPNLHVAVPNFPPGVAIPEQKSPGVAPVVQ